jgi:hypothetical protein
MNRRENARRIAENRARLALLDLADEETITKHSKRPTYSANGLIQLLANRHSKDVFIQECKDGPTQMVSNHLRMDAWAMNRSWANACAWVYEVKVSRSDFINDNKWPGYLPYCNQFYFVTPKDLIDVKEIPEQAGLLVAIGSGNGARLITKKKAPYRDVVIPESVYRYILMCRVEISRKYETNEGTREYWKKWLAQKDEDKRLGSSVASTIRKRAGELEIENRRLRDQINQYDDVKRTLTALGYNPDSFYRWDLERRIKESQEIFDSKLVTAMQEARRSLDAALRKIEQLEAEHKEGQPADANCPDESMKAEVA